MAPSIKNDPAVASQPAQTSQPGEPDRSNNFYAPSIAGNDDENSTAWKALKHSPYILACCFYANLGAFMYGFDNITLSLCLDMAPFV